MQINYVNNDRFGIYSQFGLASNYSFNKNRKIGLFHVM